MAERWPRLSKTLKGPRDLTHCQACGVEGVYDGETLRAWQEHDDADARELIVVLLCDPCSERLIEKHPRLYRELNTREPFPGAMPVCNGCRFSANVGCTNPLLVANGGAGLPLRFPQPTTAMIDYRDKGGRRRGERVQMYHGPVECRGREEVARG